MSGSGVGRVGLDRWGVLEVVRAGSFLGWGAEVV